MSEEKRKCKFEVDARVQRKDNNGCHGVVKEVRHELTTHSSLQRDDGVPMIKVHWDNGTISYFSEESLDEVQP